LERIQKGIDWLMFDQLDILNQPWTLYL